MTWAWHARTWMRGISLSIARSLSLSLYINFVTVNYRTEFVSCWIMRAKKEKKNSTTKTETTQPKLFLFCVYIDRSERCKGGGRGRWVVARSGPLSFAPRESCVQKVWMNVEDHHHHPSARQGCHPPPPAAAAMCEWVHAMGPLKLHSAKNGCARASPLLLFVDRCQRKAFCPPKNEKARKLKKYPASLCASSAAFPFFFW